MIFEEIYSVAHEHMVVQELLSQRKNEAIQVQEPRVKGRRDPQDRGIKISGGVNEESSEGSHPLTPPEPMFWPC